MTKKEPRDLALELPPDERARLARDIIASLDGPIDAGDLGCGDRTAGARGSGRKCQARGLEGSPGSHPEAPFFQAVVASVRLHPGAVEEALAAADWYEARRMGLGSDFLAELDRAFSVLG